MLEETLRLSVDFSGGGVEGREVEGNEMGGGETYRVSPPLFATSSLQHLVILKNECPCDHRSVFIGNDPSGCREVRRGDASVRVCETIDILKRSIFRRKIINGITRCEGLVILSEGTFFHVNGERHVRHFTINLGDLVILDPVPRFHAIPMDINALP